MRAQGPIGIGRTSNSDTREAAIANEAAALAWSMDQELIFFNGHLYIPVIPFILANMLQVLLHVGPRHMEPLALSSHLPSSMTRNIGAPTNILLGRSTVSTTTTVFINSLGQQFIHVGNIYIAPCVDCDLHHLLPNKFDGGHFMFGTKLDLTTTLPLHPSATTRLRVPAYVISNIAININRPPRMQRDDALHGKGGSDVTRLGPKAQSACPKGGHAPRGTSRRRRHCRRDLLPYRVLACFGKRLSS
jgi:hypothetical protein